MPLQLIHDTVSPDHVSAVEAAIGDVFAELAESQPNGLRYASTKACDGVSYMILLDIEVPTTTRS